MSVDIIFHRFIPGYENYSASFDGRIFSWQKGFPIEMSLTKSGTGYMNVALYPTERIKGKKGGNNRGVHNYVAEAWLENPGDRKQINHIDFNKENNCVSNLEWSSPKEDKAHAIKNKKGLKGRPVYQLDKKDNIIREYKSIIEASKETGIDNRTISSVCTARGGVRTTGRAAGCKTAGGYSWCYKEDFGKLKKMVNGGSKAVNQYTLDGKFVKKFDCVGDAAKSVNKSHTNISNVCRGVQKTAGGYIWRYAKKEKVQKSEIEIESENWAKLKRFPNYKISRDGRIYSILYRRTMSGSKKLDGRKYVTISDNKKKLITIAVYRLVALAYIPNPNNYKKVNHLDHDPSNDVVENLEWCDHSRDSQHTYDMELNKQARPVLQFDLKGEFIRRFKSASEACKILKMPKGSLSSVLAGRRKTCYGSKWKYETERE